MTRNKNGRKLLYVFIISVLAFVLVMGFGSVRITPKQIFSLIGQKVFGIENVHIDESIKTIFWQIRLPRTTLAFLAGMCLSVSGTIMQSVLQNPLASSYTMGVSSGAAVGASICICFGLSFFGGLTLPFFGLVFGLLTVFIAVLLTAKMDRSMKTTSIVLIGIAISLFANAIIAFIMTWSKETAQRLVFWQLGSFTLKNWSHSVILLPIAVIGIILVMIFSKEMDLMTFGEEQAKTSGVDVAKMKWVLLAISTMLAACTVSMVGIIGFVDLFTPHIARRIFGASHRWAIPASALLGGIFMVCCDGIARSIAAPLELPVGAVSAAIGAPFFIYLYFRQRKGKA